MCLGLSFRHFLQLFSFASATVLLACLAKVVLSPTPSPSRPSIRRGRQARAVATVPADRRASWKQLIILPRRKGEGGGKHRRIYSVWNHYSGSIRIVSGRTHTNKLSSPPNKCPLLPRSGRAGKADPGFSPS